MTTEKIRREFNIAAGRLRRAVALGAMDVETAKRKMHAELNALIGEAYADARQLLREAARTEEA